MLRADTRCAKNQMAGAEARPAEGKGSGMTVRQYFAALQGKRVVVLGLGVSNLPLMQLLLDYGCTVTGCDKTPLEHLPEEVRQLADRGAVLRTGPGYLDGLTADVVFRTPGMHPDIPALQALRQAGAVITSEMEAFFAVCPCKAHRRDRL